MRYARRPVDRLVRPELAQPAGPSPPGPCYTPAVPKLSVTVITRNEAADIARGARVGRLGRRDRRRRLGEHRRHGRHRAAVHRSRRRARVAGLRRAEELRGLAREPRLDSVARRRRARHAGARRRDQATARRPTPRARGYRMPRVTWHLGRWIRTTDWYPDHQLRLYDRRAGAMDRAVRARGGRRSTGDRPAARRAAALRLPRHRRSPRDHRPLHDLRRAPDARERPARRAAAAAGHPPLAFLRNYIARGGFRDGVPGFIISAMNAYYVFLKFAKLWELQRRTGRMLRARTAIAAMFSLHIDTARTWRGGQNQVLLTVNGLRAIGHRAALVAHPDGELRRRAAEGLDLIPLAPRPRWTSRRPGGCRACIKRLRPDVVHAHDPHGVAMASLALSLGSAPTPDAGARRVAPRRLSSEEQLVLPVEAPAGRLLHRRVRGDPADAASPTACRPTGPSRCTKASTSSTCSPRRR